MQWGSSDDVSMAGPGFYTNPFLFTGRYWDAHIDAYHYRARTYDPDMGRFMSRDPIGVWGDELNLGNPYAYVGNNPSTHRDPYGLYGTAVQCPAAAHGGSCSYDAGGDITKQPVSV